jgi:hypothetical protein
MATKREKREKNRRKRRFMSDWKESIPGIVVVTILLLLGEFNSLIHHLNPLLALVHVGIYTSFPPKKIGF